MSETLQEDDTLATLLDSKTSLLHDILQEKLEEIFHKTPSCSSDLAKIASEYSAIDLAYAACCLPSQGRCALYDNLLDREAKEHFLINTDSGTRVAILRHISDKEVKELIESMPPDKVVDLLEDMSERRFRRVIEIIDPKKALRIREIKEHQRNTAGRLMTNEFFAFSMETQIADVAAHIRNHPGIDLTQQIFVLNSQGMLQGFVPSRNLIVNPHSLCLKQVMRPILHTVGPDTMREEVVEIIERYKMTALAVVDTENHLIGVISQEDALDALEDIADERIANMAGTAEKIDEQESLFYRFLARAPWLVVTLCAGLLNVGVMSSFQNYAHGMLTFLICFVPLITGMSGNIGIQCSTVLVRSMAMGMLSWANKGEAMRKEILLGLVTGVVFGILCALAVYGLDFVGACPDSLSPGLVGLAVGTGLAGACSAGTLLGVFSPLFFVRIGVDPAIASGPIITACNDFLSMSIYLLIALGWIHFTSV